MSRDPRVRRARVLAGIIVGLIVGTVHALVTHVASRQAGPAEMSVQAPDWRRMEGDGSAR